jgi:membrane protein DedA with SNARE-associated domain
MDQRTRERLPILPALVLADMAGATLGYLWVRTLRLRALGPVAARLEQNPAVRILTERLHRTGAAGVFLTRLVPGTRVYTNLAAGLIDLPPRTFLAGMLPASVLWVSVITLLGALVGNRVRPYLTGFEHLSLYALLVLAILFASYLVLRYLPDLRRRARPAPVPAGKPALFLGVGVDVVIVGAVAALACALALGPLHLGELGGITGVALVVVATGLAYSLAARLGPGSTTGEVLLHIDYHRLRGQYATGRHSARDFGRPASGPGP